MVGPLAQLFLHHLARCEVFGERGLVDDATEVHHMLHLRPAHGLQEIHGRALLQGPVVRGGRHGVHEVVRPMDVGRDVLQRGGVQQVHLHHLHPVRHALRNLEAAAVAHRAHHLVPFSQQGRQQSLADVAVGTGEEDLHGGRGRQRSLAWSKNAPFGARFELDILLMVLG